MASIPNDDSIHPPAALRNRGPIGEIFGSLPWPAKQSTMAPRKVLEVSSGTGAHVSYLAGIFPDFIFQPTELDRSHLPLIDAVCKQKGLTNVLPALQLDARSDPSTWPVVGPQSLDGILCINMIHIAPFECCVGLMRACGSLLAPGGVLLLYGPFKERGVLAPESNVQFDYILRSQDPSWGIRDIIEVEAEGGKNGLSLVKVDRMPANNLCVTFRKDDNAK